MNENETEYEMVQRHVHEGQAHVKQQRKLIAHMQEKGEPIEMAKTILLQFEESQKQHELHFERLKRKRATTTDRL